MPIVRLSQDLFAIAENPQVPSEITLDYEAEFTAFSESWDGGAKPFALQLSSKLIRIGQNRWEEDEFGNIARVSYEFRLSGSGLKPVSTLAALEKAIAGGFADGTLTKLELLRAGTEFLELSVSPTGYVLRSGAQSISLLGSLPSTFDQLFELGSMLDRLANVESLSAAGRNALFAEFSAYGISDLTLNDGTETLLGLHLGTSEISLTLGGLTFALAGSFPDDFGAALSVLWDAGKQFDQTGSVDLDLLSGLAVDGFTITDDTGKVLASVTDPADGTALVYVMDGQRFGEVVGGSAGEDALYGQEGGTRSIVAGLGGDDLLFGGGGNDVLLGGGGYDALFGGSGDDTLNGGGGVDYAFFASGVAHQIDLHLTGAQTTGEGRDVLIGIEGVVGGSGKDAITGSSAQEYLFGEAGRDRLKGGNGDDGLYGGSGSDVLFGGSGDDLLFGDTGADTLNGGSGDDTLVGGDGADLFYYDGMMYEGTDLVTGFTLGVDKIHVMAIQNLSDLTFSESGNDVFIDFGPLRIIVENHTLAEMQDIDNFLF